ncbi:hypothetical protein B0H11DRAFT_2050301, partial [Mycena galericulata]
AAFSCTACERMHVLRPTAVAANTSPILPTTARRAYCTHARPHDIVSVCAPHAVPPSPPPRCPLSPHAPQSASPLARILLLCERIRLGSRRARCSTTATPSSLALDAQRIRRHPTGRTPGRWVHRSHVSTSPYPHRPVDVTARSSRCQESL